MATPAPPPSRPLAADLAPRRGNRVILGTTWVRLADLVVYNYFETVTAAMLCYPEVEGYIPEKDRLYFYLEKPQSHAFHLGRIRYFFHRYNEGSYVDPIVVDTLIKGGDVAPPVIFNGYHRHHAAVLAGVPKIEVMFTETTWTP